MKATFARHDVGLGRLILARADNASRTGPGFAAWRDRVKDLKKRYDDAKQYKEEFDRATRPADEQALGELLDLENFRKGLEAASNPGDLEGKAASFRDHLWRTRNAWNYANCVFAGECAPPGMDYNPFRRTPSAEDDERGHQGSRGASRRRFDPSGMIAVAGGASRQPLGQTTRIVGGYR